MNDTVFDEFKEEQVITDFSDALRSYNVHTPRIHLVYKFPDLEEKTEIEIFDQFIMIRELAITSKGDEIILPVAIGRSVSPDNLSSGALTIIDVRIMHNKDLFMKILEPMSSLLEKHEEEIDTVEQPGTGYEVPYFIQLISETWRYAEDMQTAVIH